MPIQTIINIFLREGSTLTLESDVLRIHDTSQSPWMAGVKLFLMEDLPPEDRAAWVTLADTLAANQRVRKEKANA